MWIIISLGIYKCSNDMNDSGKDTTVKTGENKQEDKEENTSDVQEDVPAGSFDENVRILIMNNGYRGIYHTQLCVTCSEGMLVNDNGKVEEYAPDSEYLLSKNDIKNKRMISLKGKNNGKLYVGSLERSSPARYRGVLEIYSEQDGIVVINELPVEEYLYSVVPSEMPSSYPGEALKAQAVSARTYTYYHKKGYAYPEWKAHMDDSTAFQVYMNCDETQAAVSAVDGTRGQVLTYKDEIAASFYYSTSGGYSGGAGVWNDTAADGGESHLIETGEEIFASLDEEGELAYKKFIDNGNADDVEYNEPWYRWHYNKMLDGASVKKIFEQIYAMSQSDPRKVRIRSKYLPSYKILDEDGIRDIRLLGRQKSGLVTGIMIETEHFRVSVTSQHLVRQALGCAGDAVICKDGSIHSMGGLLPSAYFYMEKANNNEEKGNNLSQITIHGAGYGHGCGMSQNGAKGLAEKGLTAEQILAYYYKGSIMDVGELRNVNVYEDL